MSDELHPTSGIDIEANATAPEFDVSSQGAGGEELKTGTTTVGLTTEDGVVLAADMRASAGNMVASKDAQKVLEVHPTAALTISGSVSAAQSLVNSLQAEVRLYETRRDTGMSLEALANLTANLLRSGNFQIVQPVLGGVDDDGSHVYGIGPGGSVMAEDYAVSGSGSPFALGVLEQEYDVGTSVEDAKTIAARAVQSATERDTASGNGLTLATITADGVTIDTYESVENAL
ncbi:MULTISPECIES: archaeal proteasome endopeptidase complex subunit beta [Halococcus]|uniref:Proteasome subunit beta n=1 Tax=Halococcus salifodinae DSM 8989 TaxID=1227456 RepID=M0N5C2_9EURY|nr:MULTISPECIES: archaeal proteasome endopeptidase complex subunit beta [Halococcus]EMA52753.1 proteasome subunit beta [Halococcus salifodinae DSM 8989]